jgi:hypothetical protein
MLPEPIIAGTIAANNQKQVGDTMSCAHHQMNENNPHSN